MAIYVYDKEGKAHAWAGTPEDAYKRFGWTTEKPTTQQSNYAGLSNLSQSTTPQAPTYESPYSTDITNALKAISNMGSFSYDPGEDEGLKAAQDEAISGVSRGAARRNMLYSDSNKSQMGKAALALVPQFEQNAFNKYQTQLGNLFNQLSTLTNLENQAYGRYRDTVSDQQTAQQNQFSNAVALAGITGYYNPNMGQIDPSLMQYSNDYMAEVQRRQATPDTTDDAVIPGLLALRDMKIQGNPELMKQYGNTMTGIPTLQNRQVQQSVAESNRNFEESVRQFNVGQQNWQKEFTFREMQQKIENALAQKRISVDQASLALQQAKFAAEQDPNSLDNQYKAMQIQNQVRNDYANNPDFAEDIQWVNSNPEAALQEIQSKAQALIGKYGYDGYQQLLKAAGGNGANDMLNTLLNPTR
jgi:hypothetical protein